MIISQAEPARAGLVLAGAAVRPGRVRARRSVPLATRTLTVLRTMRPPAEARAALARLQSAYERLFELYRQAAGPRRDANRLADAVASAEESVRAQARAARVAACSP